jgi:hypothetical protein
MIIFNTISDLILTGNILDCVVDEWKFMFYLDKPLTRVQMPRPT